MAYRTSSDTVTRSIDALRRIFRAVRLSARNAERQLGLSGAQLFVLQQLGEQSAHSVNDLAARTHTHQSSVSVVVRRLVERGLVARTHAPEDTRRVQLRLTDAGQALLRQSRPAVQLQLIQAIASLPSSRRRLLASALERLVKDMGLAGSPATMMFTESEDRDGSNQSLASHPAPGGRKRGSGGKSLHAPL